MVLISNLNLWVFLMIIGPVSTVSYNQPKFSPNASWNPNATTFAGSSTVGSAPYGIFVNTNNMIYVADKQNGRIQVWSNESINLMRTISGGLSSPWSLFVTATDDIYVDNGQNGRVDKWTLNTNFSVPAMYLYVNQPCQGLFVDINDTLYCSIGDLNQVVTKSLNSDSNITKVVAGTGSLGSASNMLSNPHGIFVDINLDLYVSDYGNNRIQLFQSGQLNATTVAGNESSHITITLNLPTGVVLDADGYLFIVDKANNRIIGSGPNGFRCLVGCSEYSNSVPDQLGNPQTLSFDSYGNIFVTDWINNRVQKFTLLTNSFDEHTTQQSTIKRVESSSTPIESTALSSLILSTIETIVFNQKGSTSISSTDQPTATESSPTLFVPRLCSGLYEIGLDCNTSSAPCNILKPCQNNASCINNNNTLHGYNCLCLPGFSGTECQIDNRPCKSNTCWNNGTCNETSNTTFECLCQSGWTSTYCETMINYCENVKCLNNGVCRPLLLNYKCECLGTSYSGQHCEITETKTSIDQIIARSIAFVAILSIICVIMFVLIMDVLKYFFGIDPVKGELEKIRRRKKKKKTKPRRIIQRFVYVHAPPPQPPPRTTTTEQDISTIEDTSV